MVVTKMLAGGRRRLARTPRLDVGELRELLSSAVILEALAVRRATGFDAAAIERLRVASERMHHDAVRPAASARAEEAFHRELVGHCTDDRVVAMALRVQERLQPYREAAPVGAGGHEAIVDDLERGDHRGAAQRIRESFAATLARLLAGVEPPGSVA